MTEDVDMYEFVKEKLKKNGQTFRWLARELRRDNSNLRRRLQNGKYLDPGLINSICKVTGDDFFFLHFPQFKNNR